MNIDDISEKGSDWQQTASTIKDKARAFQEAAAQWQRQATEATRKAAQATDAYVHENPWTVIAGVGVACFVIGFLVGRSRD